ncbi:hypothetical protein N7E81_06000 [Reichenbachiella carrageenanivorans]|uniref:Uncharacterized protein n=1 Tax=Reichenbachiella carrageenanivorans TaxID=2979869 RepID=A0ABY6D3B8_9BACT|nr:hypothetical protein [Reichenbachiella carrageenanivorans]UXX80650.1 hypothetical protein N7E81_06000 [Reichenbachiella carrageenanivorans]
MATNLSQGAFNRKEEENNTQYFILHIEKNNTLFDVFNENEVSAAKLLMESSNVNIIAA